jgi:Tfp pilus assembly pilus retraction ATPase PilT
MESGEEEGMQTLDVEIAKLVRAGMVDLETALSFASDSEALRRTLAPQDR